MRVSRSLTIKQMAIVSSVALVTIFIFMVIQLFHFVQQRRDDYLDQLKDIAHTVQQPLAEALFNRELPKAQQLLNSLSSVGVLSRADVMPSNALPVLHGSFQFEHRVPFWISRVFDLPVQTSVPLYSPYRRSSIAEPIGYLVLQVDSFRVYQSILQLFSAMTVTYLLLALVLSIAISWAVNRLLVYPLRAIAGSLQSRALGNRERHLLVLPERHKDDEFGILVRSYNRSQTELAKAYKKLSRMSTRHPLTHLPNHRLFSELVQQYLQVVALQKGGCSLFVVGVETLSEIEGILGSELQSALMLEIADRLVSSAQGDCLVAQLRYNEFALLAKSTSQLLSAMLLAKQVMEQLNRVISIQDIQLRPSASIGIALFPDHGDNTELLLRNAQLALHSARMQGKNNILFFEQHLTEIAHKRLTQESAILQGMAEDQFSLYFQPQIDMSTGKIVGAEALLRWHGSDGNAIGSPDEFIPLAEETGLIIPLGDWVLEEACRILAKWQQQGIRIPLAVNLSAKQLQYGKVVARVQALLRLYKFDPGLLTLELTETLSFLTLGQELQQLKALRELGISLALDDFGTGYSCLTHLHCLPVNMIKVDRSFIQGLPGDNTLVRIIAMIAGVLQLEVVVEGVENHEQQQWLLEHDINCAQGYLYSPALSREQFEKYYLDHQAISTQ